MTLYPTLWAREPGYRLETIPSYLYVQYNEDDDLRAFVDAYNQLTQEIIDWFAGANLPIYTGDPVSGALLDWVALGLYGMPRPVLPAAAPRDIGTLGTGLFGSLMFDEFRRIAPTEFYATTDDVFRRCMTWNFYKGDGRTFNVRWLKRRVQRFLTGENGAPLNPGQTYQISVTFGVDNQVTIRLVSGVRNVVSAALFGAALFGTTMYDESVTTWTQYAPLEYAEVFKAAVDAGVLQLPFQFDWTVSIV